MTWPSSALVAGAELDAMADEIGCLLRRSGSYYHERMDGLSVLTSVEAAITC
jgi:hypothetical protein